MDELDHQLLRELGTDKILLWGGTDPRISASDLAKRLRVDKSTILARMRAWEEAGFLKGFTALPSVGLFDLKVYAAGVRVEDARAKDKLLDDLARVEGMLAGMEHVGEWVGFAFAERDEEGAKRWLADVARIDGVAETQPPMLHHVPRCEIVPTALGWRILQAVRAEGPRAPLGALAKRVGVSPNTFRARYEKLVEGRAVWSIPNFDFGKYRGAILARLVLAFDRATPRARVLADLRRAVEGVMEHPSPELPVEGSALLSVHVQARSMGDLEEMTLAARAVPNVLDVEALHPRRFRVYGGWMDARVEAAIQMAKP